jgi:hypothetical protein
MSDFLDHLRTPQQRLAWLIAVAADVLQIAALPLFAEGGFSPADTILDIVVAFLLIRLLGWHWVFLPSMAAELVPGLDLVPTWTAAVYYATRGELPTEEMPQAQQVTPGEVEIIPPEPATRRR